MEITYGRSAEHTILSALDLMLDNAGYVQIQDSDEYVSTVCGDEAVRIDEVGGFVHGDEEKVMIVHDNFSCVCEYVEGTE